MVSSTSISPLTASACRMRSEEKDLKRMVDSRFEREEAEVDGGRYVASEAEKNEEDGGEFFVRELARAAR